MVNRIERFFQRDLWMADPAELKGLAGFHIRVLRLAVVASSDFRDSAMSVRATGLVYTTLLSLVPFLAVMFSVLKAFEVHEQIEPFLAQGLEPLGPKGSEITSRIIEFVGNLKVGVLGAVGVVGLFYTTYSLIDKIEESLNGIWRVKQSRPITRKFTDYLSVVLVGPVLVFAAFGLTASAQSHWIVQRILQIEPLGTAVLLTTQLMPFFFLCFAFTFLYKFMPYTQVRLLSALMGGIVAGVLWQLAGIAFASFVATSARYSAIYSSFAILILFLIWLYVGWLIVLIGAQMAYYHQHPSAYLTLLRWKQNTFAFREHLALGALREMARRFYSGRAPFHVSELAAALKVPYSALEELMEDFIDCGLIFRTAEPRGVALAKPPEQVSILEVLELVRCRDSKTTPMGDGGTDPVTTLLRQRDQAIHASLAGITLKSLATGEGIPTSGPEDSSRVLGQTVP